MASELTMHVIQTSGKGAALGTTPITYEVHGLPSGQSAQIAHFKPHWKLRRGQSTWVGEFATAEAALQLLKNELSKS